LTVRCGVVPVLEDAVARAVILEFTLKTILPEAMLLKFRDAGAGTVELGCF
jgi:hypothetical protein